MRRTLFCRSCGATRQADTTEPLRGPGVLTCFRCANVIFTTDATNAPPYSPSWLVTDFDRRFLRSLRIARGSQPVEASL